SSHKRPVQREIIEVAGAALIFSAALQSGLRSHRKGLSKSQALLRQAAKQPVSGLWDGHRIAVAVTASAHRVNQIVMPEERGPFHAGELRPLIRADQHLVLRFVSPHRHEQSLQYDIRGLTQPMTRRE